MKFTIEKSKFLAGFEFSIDAYDDDKEIITIEEEGQVVLPSRNFIEIIRKAPTNLIEIETIDNNIYGSEYTLGFDTALNIQCDYIDAISDTGMSLPGRVFFVETLGAWDGYLTNSSVLMGMADFSVQRQLQVRNIG